jgi:hypothetical protein
MLVLNVNIKITLSVEIFVSYLTLLSVSKPGVATYVPREEYNPWSSSKKLL